MQFIPGSQDAKGNYTVLTWYQVEKLGKRGFVYNCSTGRRKAGGLHVWIHATKCRLNSEDSFQKLVLCSMSVRGIQFRSLVSETISFYTEPSSWLPTSLSFLKRRNEMVFLEIHSHALLAY